MDINSILACVDHTLLTVTATPEEIEQTCLDGVHFSTASVCIPPSYVRFAKECTAGRVPVCTVVGFPNGYNTTAAKSAETADALNNGADEIDMVIHIGRLKMKDYAYVEDEIKQLKTLCGEKILKVIIEACLLTDEEKVAMCRIVTSAGADYIKTSTGFSLGGATREDIALFAANIGAQVKMKAAGGIKTLQDAQDFLDLGCSRLGTSSIVKILKNQEATGY